MLTCFLVPEMTGPPTDDFLRRLDRMAHRALGGAAVGAQRLTGGASQEIWAFEVPAAPAPRHVLRRVPPGDRMDRRDCVALDTEAAVIAAVAARGVPVPAIRHVLTADDELGSGFVMDRVAGEAMGRRIVHDAHFAGVRRALAAACGRALAGIHATPPDALPRLPLRQPQAALDLLAAQLHGDDEPRPVFELALRRLRQSCPPPVAPQLVHGDFRTGNLLVDDAGLAAVLDWESCHLGDPIADLGWICMPVWRFGRLDRPCGGFGSREALIAGYGRPVDPDRLRFWEVFGMLRWGLTCVAMAGAVRAGERSIERAAVGRRASEAELELLHALGGGTD